MTTYPVLQQGATGPFVVALQTALNNPPNGFKANPPLVVDGNFGPATETALKAWQGAQFVDGIVDSQDWLGLGNPVPPPPPPPPSNFPLPPSGTTAGYNTDGGTHPSNYGSYSMVMMNAFDSSAISATKAAGKIPIVYQDLSSTRTNDSSLGNLVATGVRYVDANANHPDWFLLDSGGHRIVEKNFPTQMLMDYGNVAYQNAWANDVIARMQSLGVQWVFADNALSYHMEYVSSPIPKYPTDAAVQAATLAMMKVVTPALNAAGIGIIYNVGFTSMFDRSVTNSLWINWLPWSNGLCNEFPQYFGYANDIADQKSHSVALGKVSFFGHSNGLSPDFDVIH